MTPLFDIARLFIRTLCGLLAGLVIGLLVEIIFFWPDDPDLDPKHFILHFGRGRVPVIGPGIACATCVFVAAIAGGVEIKGLAKHIIVGALSGVVVGSVVIGGFVFPAIAVALKDPAYPAKAHASYQLAGILRGVPMGALLGFATGLGYNCYSRSPRRHAQAHARQVRKPRVSDDAVDGPRTKRTWNPIAVNRCECLRRNDFSSASSIYSAGRGGWRSCLSSFQSCAKFAKFQASLRCFGSRRWPSA